ncbi:MAG: M24 family metallopeptidase [Deltaproteobacteria bacterium]|uniref:M24 family metallopeptidase n=1 Tax=Desulfobacula sp. TaxID=2593537 RepID=UPI00199A8C78|nr:M24 family metallopeptidase [Candidatus Desulfobacula maris]MBL6992670.1 M24 family metallopeptidase [Desulfobacula sp.]
MTLFSRNEFLERIAKTKSSMAKKGIEILVVCDPANMNYLTGYDGWSFYVPQAVLVIDDQEEPIWIGRNMDVNGARHTAFIHPENMIGYPEDYIQSDIKHPMNFMADMIREKGWAKKNIGVETDAYYYTARSDQSLKKSLGRDTLIDGNLLVSWVRIIKSDTEIELMKQAGQIAENVMSTALANLAPGTRECDAVAAVYQAQVSGTPDFGGDYPSIVPMMPTGEKTSAPHLTWTDNPYESGQAVNLELAGCRHRYHCPIARTAFIGKNPPEKLKTLADITVEGLNLTLDGIKPGLTGEDVERIWREHIAKKGFEKESRIGYSMGLNYPPDWGEHTASLRPGDKTILKPNMTFHMILGMWMDNFGFECSESFRVTQTGAKTFASFDRKLFVIQ